MEGLPITLLELVQLTEVGVDPSSISWTNLTLNSDKWVCVRQTHEDSNHIFIVDLDDPAKLQRHKITAESAIMHLDQPIIALQGAGVLQVFNLATKMKLASIATEDQILFWKWISSTTLAYITDKAVYHWHVLDDKQSPTKVFDRDQQLAEMQIVNYLVTDHNAASKNWYCLVGLTAKDGKIIGASQLYSEEKKAGQITPAFAAAFASYDKNASLLVFVVKNGELYYLHVIPVGQPETRPTFVRQAREIYFPPETAGVDWPIAIQVSEKYKVIYLLTKFGYFHLFDLETAKLIFMNRISADSILYTAPRKKDDGGMVCLNKKGQVLAVNVNDKEIVSFLATQLNDVELSKEFLNRNAHTLPAQVISEIKAGLQKQLDQLLVEKRFFEAATLASASPDLRTLETVEKFKAQPAEPTQPPVLMQYLSILLQRGKLNKFESIEAVKMALGMYKTDMIGMWLKDDKLDCTEELGDLLFSTDKKMAMSAYYRAEAKDKVIKCFIETGDFEKLLAYAQKCNYWPDLTNTFVDIVDTNQSQALVMATSILSKNDRLLDPKRVVDILDRKHCVQEITTLLLAILKNTPEERDLQTRLLEVNLKAGSLGVQVANGILEKGVFTYFDKRKIADLCDQVGLKDKAMQLKAKHAKDALFEEELQKLVEVFKSGFISQNDFDRRKKEIEKKHGK